jgi:sec-independent protein translocase protein TatC
MPAMSSAPAVNPAKEKPREGFDPEEYRMTIGDHLEELRHRMFLGLGGFVVAFIVFMILGERVVYWVCRPLFIALARNGLPTTIYFTDPAEVFMTYIKAAMISAGAFAAPWMLYQLWQFVAAGLYPKERKYVTKYLPLSISLLIIGMVFLYVYVLPLMLEFFIHFSIGMPPPFGKDIMHIVPNATTQPIIFPILDNDPNNPAPGSCWVNATTGMLKICIAVGKVRVMAWGSESATTPIITLGTYFEMVVGLLLSFGLAFQTPLVVLALVRIGILEIETLKKMRRFVYFIMSIVAAVIVPDVVTGMIALLVPLILLYEFGIFLAWWTTRKTEPDATGV